MKQYAINVTVHEFPDCDLVTVQTTLSDSNEGGHVATLSGALALSTMRNTLEAIAMRVEAERAAIVSGVHRGQAWPLAERHVDAARAKDGAL